LPPLLIISVYKVLGLVSPRFLHSFTLSLGYLTGRLLRTPLIMSPCLPQTLRNHVRESLKERGKKQSVTTLQTIYSLCRREVFKGVTQLCLSSRLHTAAAFAQVPRRTLYNGKEMRFRFVRYHSTFTISFAMSPLLEQSYKRIAQAALQALRESRAEPAYQLDCLP
jgi:hypothetical protein